MRIFKVSEKLAVNLDLVAHVTLRPDGPMGGWTVRFHYGNGHAVETTYKNQSEADMEYRRAIEACEERQSITCYT